MAGKKDIEAGRAFVRLFFKDEMTKSLQKSLRNVGAEFQKAGKHMLALGGAITGALAGTAGLFAKIGSDIADMSARTGVGTNALSEFGHAASMTGSSLADVENGIRKMQRTLLDAATGTKTAVDALAMLGLKSEELMGLSPEQQFTTLASRITAIEDPTTRAAVAMEVFGKSGTKLLPMMQNLDALTAEARELGLSITPEQAAMADELGDAWDRVKASFTGAALQIGSALAPLLTDLAAKIQALMKPVIEFISHNKELVIGLFAVGVAIAGAGTALIGLGAAATYAASALGVILSPIGLIVAGLAGLAAAVIHFGVGWDNALGYAKTFFENAKGFFANFQQNMGILAEWLKGNWKTLFGDLGRLLLTFGKNAINNFQVTLEAFSRIAGAVFRHIFSVDFVKFIWEGIKKALPILADFAIKAGEMMTGLMTGGLSQLGAASMMKNFTDQMQKGGKQSLGEELKGIMADAAKDLKFFEGFKFSAEGPKLNLERPPEAAPATIDGGAAQKQIEDQQKAMVDAMKDIEAQMKKGGVLPIPTMPGMKGFKMPSFGPPASLSTPASPTAEGGRTAATPMGVTFSAEAAMASGFGGGSPQQKALDDIRKTNAAAVEHLKSIGTGIWRFVDGLVYG